MNGVPRNASLLAVLLVASFAWACSGPKGGEDDGSSPSGFTVEEDPESGEAVAGRYGDVAFETEVEIVAGEQWNRAEAHYRVGDADARVVVEDFQTIALHWKGESIDGAGELSAGERKALAAIGKHPKLAEAIAQVPLRLACRGANLRPAGAAALLFPWQLVLKYLDDAPEKAAFEAAEETNCEFYTTGPDLRGQEGTGGETDAGSATAATPDAGDGASTQGGRRIPNRDIVLLSLANTIPAVFAYGNLDDEGWSDGEGGAETTEAMLTRTQGQTPPGTPPGIEAGVACHQQTNPGYGTGERFRDGEGCRGACGDGCDTNCEPVGSRKRRCTEELAKATFVTLSCKTHEGCRLHDHCYDCCKSNFGDEGAIVPDRETLRDLVLNSSALPWEGEKGANFNCHRYCDRKALEYAHDEVVSSDAPDDGWTEAVDVVADWAQGKKDIPSDGRIDYEVEIEGTRTERARDCCPRLHQGDSDETCPSGSQTWPLGAAIDNQHTPLVFEWTANRGKLSNEFGAKTTLSTKASCQTGTFEATVEIVGAREASLDFCGSEGRTATYTRTILPASDEQCEANKNKRCCKNLDPCCFVSQCSSQMESCAGESQCQCDPCSDSSCEMKPPECDCTGPDCDDPPAPGPAASTGDPHLTTFDGLAYDFQGAGEFVLAESVANDLEVQVRQQPVGESGTVAANTAVAMAVDGHEVMIDVRRTPELYIDGEGKMPSTNEYAVGGGSVRRIGDLYVVTWPSGHTLRAIPRKCGILDLYFGGGFDDGTVAGLFGNADGDPHNDLYLRGSDEQVPYANGSLYPAYADSWRVAASESLFTYASGKDTSDYTLPDFPKEELSLDDLRDQAGESDVGDARKACEDAGATSRVAFEDCMIDYLTTRQACFTKSAAGSPANDPQFSSTDASATGLHTPTPCCIAATETCEVVGWTECELRGKGLSNDRSCSDVDCTEIIDTPLDKCRTHGDCTGAFARCRRPDGPAPCPRPPNCAEADRCSSKSDCDAGEACVVDPTNCECPTEKTCQPACTPGACSKGETCNTSTGACEPTPCSSDSECSAERFICIDSDNACGRDLCSTDENCEPPGRCVHNRCYDRFGTCVSDPYYDFF